MFTLKQGYKPVKPQSHLRRFFIETNLIHETQAFIRGKDANHIRNVLRMKPDDQICLFDPQGNEYTARITTLASTEIAVEIIHSALAEADDAQVAIHMAQAFLKDKKMDTLIRQLTELGVHTWHPFFAKRSVPAPNQDRLEHRVERWNKITIESQKQCLRNLPLTIIPPCTYEEMIAQGNQTDLKLIFYEECAVPIQNIIEAQTTPPRSVFTVIGPEGGFTPEEIDHARQNGFHVLSLGPRILKAETAALAASVMMQHIFGDMK